MKIISKVEILTIFIEKEKDNKEEIYNEYVIEEGYDIINSVYLDEGKITKWVLQKEIL